MSRARTNNSKTIRKPKPSEGPRKNWKHRELYDRVLLAIQALPGHFSTGLNIEGVQATDLFTLNTALGASIEQSMVDCLNGLRQLWDPHERYPLYRFVRQSQTFPDVRLQKDAAQGSDGVILGIELKGWFVLAKEGEPSFRYKVTPAACAPQDLLVVVPWGFKNVISGAPVLMQPIIAEARFAAQMRNYYWQHGRESEASAKSRQVNLSSHKTPYPGKADKCADVPVSDGGKNFGRVSRCGIFDPEIDRILQSLASGIPLSAWQEFLRIFTEKMTSDSVYAKLDHLRDHVVEHYELSEQQLGALQQGFTTVADAFDMLPAQSSRAEKKPR